MKCYYHAYCWLYNPHAFTCSHPTAENGHCGTYRVFRDKLTANGMIRRPTSEMQVVLPTVAVQPGQGKRRSMPKPLGI
jgi:hypothetical protein